MEKENVTKGSNKKIILIIAIILVVMVLIVGIIINSMIKQKKEEKAAKQIINTAGGMIQGTWETMQDHFNESSDTKTDDSQQNHVNEQKNGIKTEDSQMNNQVETTLKQSQDLLQKMMQ